MTTDLTTKIATLTLPAADEASTKKLRGALLALVSADKKVRVLISYKRTGTKGKVRVAGVDYKGKKALAHNAVMGAIASVKLNKEGGLYITVADENRATETQPYGWTAIKPEGIEDVEVL